MPQTTDEHRARSPGGDTAAIDCLKKAGFVLTEQWTWIPPKDHEPTEREWDAIDYLIFEWDFGGLERE